MPTMFRKRKDANEETMAMGRVVGVRNASPAHRVAALQEREGGRHHGAEELPRHEGPASQVVLGGERGAARESSTSTPST